MSWNVTVQLTAHTASLSASFASFASFGGSATSGRKAASDMGYSVGFDEKWNRWIGYGVPAYCDHPGCTTQIDRGLAYVCGGDLKGGERGCGLYFCGEHLFVHRRLPQLCESCSKRRKRPFTPKPEHPDWIRHLLTAPSWSKWRQTGASKKWLAKYREKGGK